MISTLVELKHLKDFEEQGFYSKSYLAIDERLNREVAVKDIIYDELTSEDDFKKYFDEAMKLSLAAHPRVLPVYYVGIDHNGDGKVIPRIVSCYFRRGSLNRLLESVYTGKKTLKLEHVIRFAHDIIQGMIHLHSLDIVHLDLKASNVYISDDMKLVIGDFGQAKFIKDGIIFDPVDIYPALQPVEAITKKAIDKTVDIYQFGLLLYAMLCYDKYREALDNTYQISTQHLTQLFRDKPENVAELKAKFKENIKRFTTDVKSLTFPDRLNYPYYVPSELQKIIHKCLEPQVANRYNNFYEIQEDLNDFIFPDGVSSFYQDLETNTIHFIKDEKPCEIVITKTGDTYHAKATKNNRNPAGFDQVDITKTKLPKVLFTFAKDI